MAIERRQLLTMSMASLVTAALSKTLRALDADLGLRSLEAYASQAGLVYGSAVGSRHLKTDEMFAQAVVSECGIIVPEFELNWDILQPDSAALRFDGPDWLAHFAQTHGMLFRGHPLVWYQDTPSWFKSQVTSSNAESRLVDHVTTIVRHYAGRVESWDVVNEIVAYYMSRPEGLNEQIPWFQFLGSHYIDSAFHAAAVSDPQALLVWNQNHVEYDESGFEANRVAVLKLLDKLLSRRVPVHAIGIQAHLMIERYPFSEDKLNRFMNEISDMGLSILITEMDVTETADRSTSIAVRDQKIADEYARFLSVALDNKAVIAVLTWGLSDRYTWLSDYAKRQDGQPVRPLPLDADLKKTQAWRAIANAFQHAPRRPRPTRGSGASSSSLGQRWPARCIAAGTTSLF